MKGASCLSAACHTCHCLQGVWLHVVIPIGEMAWRRFIGYVAELKVEGANRSRLLYKTTSCSACQRLIRQSPPILRPPLVARAAIAESVNLARAVREPESVNTYCSQIHACAPFACTSVIVSCTYF